MEIRFRKLSEPTAEIAECFERWENDPSLIHLIRPNKDKDALEKRESLTAKDLEQRLEHDQIYLIYPQDQLVGEMDYQIEPIHLCRKETGTDWIGIMIGEAIARGKGIGSPALQYLENEIKQQNLRRIELGVFEFNTNTIKLYHKRAIRKSVGFQTLPIGRISEWRNIFNTRRKIQSDRSSSTIK